MVRGYARALGSSRWTWVALGSGGTLVVTAVLWRYVSQQQAEARRAPVRRWTCFASGFCSALAVVGCVHLSRRYGHPNPDHVFSVVLPKLRANGEVRALVGSHLQPGLFRAYAYAGGVEWRGLVKALKSGTLPVNYKPTTLQLMFQVSGERSSALVSVEVLRQTIWSRALKFQSLAVDLPSGERLVLKGASSDVVFQGYTRLR